MVDYSKSLPWKARDLAGNEVIPHPDGQPWKKSCGDKNHRKGDPIRGYDWWCAYRRNQEGNTARCSIKHPANPHPIADEERFFCVHRQTEDGFHRVCAGWHCCHHGKEK
jgi:hypothetical protein